MQPGYSGMMHTINEAGTTTVTFSDPTPAGGGLFSVTATITDPVIPGKLFVDVEVTHP